MYVKQVRETVLLPLARALSVILKNTGSWRATFELTAYALRKEGIRGTTQRILKFIGRYGRTRSTPLMYRSRQSVHGHSTLRTWHEDVLALPAPEFCSTQRKARASGPSGVATLAFFLPQYHPFPENDIWWGKGFTEWRNVARALPQFFGHYQPKVPADLGYYDLRTPGILAAQADLAKKAGLSGFCFYFYWFAGKTLMEEPLLNWKDSASIDFPYCLCWANENWTRRWDGLEDDVLIAQEHSPEDDLAFIEHIAAYLCDKRYFTINGRPLLLVYRSDKLPEARATIQRWRGWWREKTGRDLFIACVHAHSLHANKTHDSPEKDGFDACVEFPPVGLPASEMSLDTSMVEKSFSGRVYDYISMTEQGKSFLPQSYAKFRGVMPSWDNSARRKQSGFIFHDSSPNSYRDWLHEALTFARWFKQKCSPNLVFINAWNEWAEGAYLEPDLRYGHAYLNATADAHSSWTDGDLACLRETEKRSEVVCLLHLHYPELAEEFCVALSQIQADVWITITDENCFNSVSTVFPEARIFLVPNRGRDIAPFLAVGRMAMQRGYELGLKLHSKRSPHRVDGDRWRKTLVAELLPPWIDTIALLELFRHDRLIGLVAPNRHRVLLSDHRGSNAPWLNRLAVFSGVEVLPDEQFVAGSMFWFRFDALRALFDIPIVTGDFSFETGQVDGTLAHAIERFLGASVRKLGCEIFEMNEILSRSTHHI